MNIVGPGANLLTVSGNNASRVFNIGSGNFNVSISGLTIANGRTTSDESGNALAGGILNNSTGTLTISACIFNGNNVLASNVLPSAAASLAQARAR